MIRTVPRRGFRFVGAVAIEAPTERFPAPVMPELPSIAVLPFDNLSLEPRIAQLADVLVEDVTALLARVAGFFVVSSRSAFVYRDRVVDLRIVGRELGVRYIVTGSVRVVGDQARVTVQLTEADNGMQRWSERFDVMQSDLVDLQADVARAVVSQLEPQLNRAELAVIRRRGSDNLDAWSCYRKAVGALAVGGWTEESIAETRAHLRQAVALDPQFGLAHAYHALVASLALMFGVLAEDDMLRVEIRGMAATALELDPDNSEVLSFTGCAFADLGDPRVALDLTERALELDPSNAHARLVHGTCLTFLGRPADGLADLRLGMRLSPRDRRLGMWGTGLAGCLLRLGHYAEAVDEARLAFRRDGNLYMAALIESLALHRLGRGDEARMALASARRVRPRLALGQMQVYLMRIYLGADAGQELALIWEQAATVKLVAGCGSRRSGVAR
jgi:adenylate cyclase